MSSSRTAAIEDDDYDAPQGTISAPAGAIVANASTSEMPRSVIENQRQQRSLPALPTHLPHVSVVSAPVMPAPSAEVARLLRGFLKQSIGMQAIFLVSPPPVVADAAPVHLLAAFLSLPQAVRAELFQAQPNNGGNGGSVRTAIARLTKSLSLAERECIASVAAAASRASASSSSERRPSEAAAVSSAELRHYIERHSAAIPTLRAAFEEELTLVAAATVAKSAVVPSRPRSIVRSAQSPSSRSTSSASSSVASALPSATKASEVADEIRFFLLGQVPDVFMPRATDAFQFDDDQYPIDSTVSISNGSSPTDAASSLSGSGSSTSFPESKTTASPFFAGAAAPSETGILDPYAGPAPSAAATTIGVRHASDLAAAAALRSLPPFMRGRNVGHTPLATEVAAMMHAFGDVARPSPAAVLALADYVRAWMTPIAAQLALLKGVDQIAKLQQQFPLVCRLYFQFQIARRQVKDCDPGRFASQSLRVESDAAKNATSARSSSSAAVPSSPRMNASASSTSALPVSHSSGLGFSSAPQSPSLSSPPSSRLPASIATLEDVFLHADRAAEDDDARLFGASGHHGVSDHAGSGFTSGSGDGEADEMEDDERVSDSEEGLRDDDSSIAASQGQRDEATSASIADSDSAVLSSSSVSSSSSSSVSSCSSSSSSSLSTDDADLAADAAVHCLSYEAHLPALDLIVGPRQRQRIFASLTTRLMSEAAYLAFARARSISFACGSARTAFAHAIAVGGDGSVSPTTSTLHTTALTLLGLVAWDRVGLIVEIALELRRRRPGSGPRAAYFDVTLAMHLVQTWSWMLHQQVEQHRTQRICGDEIDVSLRSLGSTQPLPLAQSEACTLDAPEVTSSGASAGIVAIHSAGELPEQRPSKRTRRGGASRSIH